MVEHINFMIDRKCLSFQTSSVFEISDLSLCSAHLTFLGLSFLICNMGLVTNSALPTSGVIVEMI